MALSYRKLKGYKYLVAEVYRCAVPELVGVTVDTSWFTIQGGELVVQPGYAWNGASGPAIDTPITMQASLVHDVGYQCVRAGFLTVAFRGTFDAILWRLMRPKAGASKLTAAWGETRALYYFAAVRAFGWSAAKHKDVEPQHKIFTA